MIPQQFNKVNLKGLTNILITVFSMGISFLISILLTNYFGADVYGDYILVYSYIEILAMLSLFGLDQILIVFVPRYINDNSTLSFLYKNYHKRVLVASVVLSIVTFSISFLPLSIYTGRYTEYFFRYGSVMIPFFASSLFRQYFITGLKKVLSAQFPEKILKPLLFLIGSFLVYKINSSTDDLIYVYFVSIIIPLIIGHFILKKYFTFSKIDKELPIKISGFKEGLYFLATINLLGVISGKIDTIMISSILTTSETGAYNIFFKISSLITLFLAGIRVVMAPNVSQLLEENKRDEARMMVKSASRLALVLGVVSFLVLIFGNEYIFMLFKNTGTYLSANKLVLYVLCFMQLISLSVGPVASVLLVSKSFKPLLIGQIIAVVVNVSLNAMLLPTYGLVGAALATIVSVSSWYAYLLVMNFKNGNINPTAFGK
jgi:O-antigen/teichoic acid export membrane protein